MKKTIFLILVCIVTGLAMTSCLGDNEPTTVNTWQEKNDAWMLEKSMEKDADGNPVYERITCPWDPDGYVLMKWHNPRTENEAKLSPLSTSTIDVRYEVSTIDSVMVDNSRSRVNPAPGVYRSVLNKNIGGWIIGLSNMHVGDTCTILIPYTQAYGSVPYNGLKGYSSLIFNVRLVDIPAYEKPL